MLIIVLNYSKNIADKEVNSVISSFLIKLNKRCFFGNMPHQAVFRIIEKISLIKDSEIIYYLENKNEFGGFSKFELNNVVK